MVILTRDGIRLKFWEVQAGIEGGVLGFGPWEHGEDVAQAVGAFGAAGRCACGGAEARHGGGEQRGLLWTSAVEWEAQGAVGC